MADYISQFTGPQIDARLAKVSQLETGKQDKLVSGTNIKTINGDSILGSGDITIQGGDPNAVKYTAQTLTDAQKAQARTNIAAASAAELGQIVTDLTGIEADIDSLEAAVAAINVGDYVTATTLPTASASTMGHIYLIGPDANNNYDRYFTQESGGTCSWVPLGSTQIDLSSYATIIDNDFADEDLVIADENEYAIVAFGGGEIRTKNFDSSKVKVESGETSDDDFDIRDENGFIIVQFNGGHIKTKNFDSSLVGRSHWYGKSWYGFGTSITDTSTVGKYPPYLAQISGLVFTNHGNGGSGITSFSDEELYDDIMTADISGADLITLEVGANDGQAPLGTIYDGLPDSEVQDNSTFCGALNLCIRRLQKDSNAQIVVMCSPSGRYQRTDPTNIYDGDETSGPDNHTILDRNEAIRKVCMLNSCWFIPAGAMDGFGYARMNASNDLNTDNVHHTNLGGYNFAQAIWAFLKNIPLFYTSI